MLANAMKYFGGAAGLKACLTPGPLCFDQVQVSSPQFRCLSALVPSVGEGDAVTINAVAYTVASIEHDATGMARIGWSAHHERSATSRQPWTPKLMSVAGVASRVYVERGQTYRVPAALHRAQPWGRRQTEK